MKSPLLDILFWTGAAAYLAIMHLTPFEGDFIIKALPILLLSAGVLSAIKGTERTLLLAALIFSAGGDVALTFVRGVNQNAFIIGLGLFLTAHIFYCIIFARRIQVVRTRIPLIVLLAAFSVTMGIVLFPKLGDMAVPVFAYITVITCMGAFSALHEGSNALLMAGAFTFILSDSCIAVNKFLQPFEGAGYAIMITYYLAQYMIVKFFLLRSAQK